ncbi:MAG: histidinol phosphatase [Deltaproteobacteria bacterium]|nr:MAG: histidinol phosphatase [Deltaproteobacteria bacterium]
MTDKMLVSLHGGHSGQFCTHASDNLEEMVLRYIELGFTHVGISEHMPSPYSEFMYDDEKEAGFTPELLLEKFGLYIKECERLKLKYKEKINLYTGFETETFPGSEEYIFFLIKQFKPDYIVGSVHHVNGYSFDFSKKHYADAVNSCSGILNFYRRYFDIQYEMLVRLKPQVAGHFDLVRIFDKDYDSRIKEKTISDKIDRNLQAIKELDIIMDFNQRALFKNMKEPYPANSIFKKAVEMGIKIVAGDDSHDVQSVGYNFESAVKTLENHGVIMTTDIFSRFFNKN